MGSDPASLRWHAIRTPDVRIISPDTASATALRTLRYIEAVRPSIGYGFRHGPMRIPFVLHPMNFRSNGLVMWLPKRVEFLHVARHRRLLDAVGQAARGARIPPRRAVQQPPTAA